MEIKFTTSCHHDVEVSGRVCGPFPLTHKCGTVGSFLFVLRHVEEPASWAGIEITQVFEVTVSARYLEVQLDLVTDENLLSQAREMLGLTVSP